MSPKSPRPPVFDLGKLMVKPTIPTPEPVPSSVIAPPEKTVSANFRTSVYFSRAVHDKLRTIAFEERSSITDLINEGLDHVLRSRGYPSIEEIKKAETGKAG